MLDTTLAFVVARATIGRVPSIAFLAALRQCSDSETTWILSGYEFCRLCSVEGQFGRYPRLPNLWRIDGKQEFARQCGHRVGAHVDAGAQLRSCCLEIESTRSPS